MAAPNSRCTGCGSRKSNQPASPTSTTLTSRAGAMIDTGATMVAINQSTARRIGIRLTPADFKYSVSTANGETPAAGVIIDSLQIGRISVDHVEAVVLEDRALEGTLIGMNFLKQPSKFEVRDDALLLVQ